MLVQFVFHSQIRTLKVDSLSEFSEALHKSCNLKVTLTVGQVDGVEKAMSLDFTVTLSRRLT